MTFDHRAFLSQLTTAPGVYRYYDKNETLLYVGKARNLKKRVSTYFLRASGNPRIEAMVSQIARAEVTLVHSEDEALLLEATLIKQLHPKYNIVYRDDKSYPYIKVSKHAYPRLSFYRGQKTTDAQYFGPFLSSYAVRDTLVQIQKLFKIRTCRDEFFKHRTRPCLEYQIKRCSGPCVALITPDEYQKDLESAHRMLAGRSDELAQDLGRKMEAAAQALEYERAAQFRDQILALRQVREKRSITGGAEDLDVVVIALHPAHSCVVLMTVREGLNLGHRSFFPKHAPHVEADELLESFLNQHYQQFIPPPEIVLSHDLDEEDAAWLLARFKEKAGKRVKLITNPRGDKQKILDMAGQTAQQALAHFLAEAASMDERLLELAQALELDAPPQRMECFDISHNQGDKTVASCVVFGPMGPMKQAYRKYNIEGITGGDDYAAIHQAVSRRFAKGENLPDVLFIDGGQGQLNAALKALEGVDCPLRVVAIAKGSTRRAGMEELLMPEREFPLRLPPDSSALHLIQHIRDESHRFALMGHRARLEKARTTSSLEAIEGLGPARRKALLKSFGGVSAIKRASVEEIAQVEGINRTLAERIFAYFR